MLMEFFNFAIIVPLRQIILLELFLKLSPWNLLPNVLKIT